MKKMQKEIKGDLKVLDYWTSGYTLPNKLTTWGITFFLLTGNKYLYKF